MTAAEIAEFRALLRAQAAPSAPRRASWGLAPRHADSAAVAVLQGDEIFADYADVEGPALIAPLAFGLADPPPARPPLFGRRAEPEPIDRSAPPPEGDAMLLTAPVVLDGARRQIAWSYETPDVEPPRPQPPASPSGPLAGAAGWSRVRPPSAQRRLLARLEAVFLAEAQGLDARRAAAT